MKVRTILAAIVAFATMAGVAYAASDFHQVKAQRFDPAKTFLVQAKWLDGIGCPTNAKVAIYPSTTPTGTYTDPACATGDSSDQHNAGLLLVKTGPTTNNASAVAQLKGVEGMTLTELGYDIRKPVSTADDRGSHCGAGAPRFNVTTTTGFYAVGCTSPAATTQTAGTGWLRLRWGGSAAGTLQGFLNNTTLTAITGQVKSITIVFDEGQDATGGPDTFGLAVLDNIDVNGTLVGDAHKDKGKNGDKGKNKDDRDNDSDD